MKKILLFLSILLALSAFPSCTASKSITESSKYLAETSNIDGNGEKDYEGNQPKVDTKNTDNLYETYVQPLNPTGGILIKEWASPADISSSDLIQFCAFNNLLGKETNPPNTLISDGGQYIDTFALASDVENSIQHYFDISSDYLKSAKEYEYEGNRGMYLLGCGFGGSGSAKVLQATQKEDLLQLEIGIFSPDNDNPSITGILSIKLEEDSFNYLSYIIK